MCALFTAPPLFFYGLFGTTLRLYRELQQLESQSNANRSSRRLWGGRSWWKMGRWHLKRIWWSDLPIFWDMKKRFGVRFRWFFVYIILFSLYRKTHVFLLRRKSWDYYSHLISGIFVQISGWRMLQKNWRLVTWWQVTLNIFQPDTLWRICGRYLYHCILMYLLYYIIFIYLFIDIYFKSMSLPGFNRNNQACSHQFHPKVSGMMIVMTPAMQNSCRAARWLRWFFSTGGTISSAKLSIANNFRRVHFDVRIYGMGKTRHTYIQ